MSTNANPFYERFFMISVYNNFSDKECIELREGVKVRMITRQMRAFLTKTGLLSLLYLVCVHLIFELYIPPWQNSIKCLMPLDKTKFILKIKSSIDSSSGELFSVASSSGSVGASCIVETRGKVAAAAGWSAAAESYGSMAVSRDDPRRAATHGSIFSKFAWH